VRITVANPKPQYKTISFDIVGSPDLSELDKLQGPLTLDIRRKGKKRSLDANSYCWALLDQLSEVMQMPAVELYRNAIREIGGVSQIHAMQAKAIPDFIRAWKQNGEGWMVDVLDDCKVDGWKHIKVYFGSSTYDTRQMARLIGNIVQDCKAVGISTDTAYIKSLLEAWGK